MITVNSAPVTNKILLDANDTLISITSTNGIGYYFRAKIYIDDELFDEQSWSRKDNYTAEKNLRDFYKAYFLPQFNQNFVNGFDEQFHLKKKITIIIQERLMADDSLAQSITLREFYILFNNNPELFTDSSKAKFLGIEASKIVVPYNGKISVPVYTNTTSETVVATLTNNFGTILNAVTITSATAKSIYLYNFDLSPLTLANNTIYFILTIQVGSTTITKAFRYLEFPDFTPKEIVFQNNFGFYTYAYLDGQMSIDNALEIATYDNKAGEEKIIEINEELSYSINTGSLLLSEKDIINQIAASYDSKLFFNGNYITIISKTKKVKQFQDRLNNYSESLVFSCKKSVPVANEFGLSSGSYHPEYYAPNYKTS